MPPLKCDYLEKQKLNAQDVLHRILKNYQNLAQLRVKLNTVALTVSNPLTILNVFKLS